MSANPETNGDDELKRKLVRRVAFAGLLIALLLGALAFIDHLGQPANDSVDAGPTYTSPVPVPKKEVSQPVKPAEPVAAVEAPKDAAPPPAVEMPTAAPVGSSPIADTPARPEVAAQPVLPRQESRSVPSSSLPATTRSAKPADPATPAEGTSAASTQFTPEAEKPPASLPPATRTPAAPPAPPRLFSGFAVQAGVFADAQRAEELRAMLMLNGIPSTLEARVQVGPFKTREEAEAARQKLKALGVEGLLLPPKGTKR